MAVEERFFIYRPKKAPLKVSLERNGDRFRVVTPEGEVVFAFLPVGPHRALFFSQDGRVREALYQLKQERLEIWVEQHRFTVEIWDEVQALDREAKGKKPHGEGEIRSPIAGKVTRVFVKEGEAVKEGQCLLIMEAMKMENEFKAPFAGRVKKLYVQEGQVVEPGNPLVEVEA